MINPPRILAEVNRSKRKIVIKIFATFDLKDKTGRRVKTSSEPETVSDRRRRSWRRHKFASLDTKSWDQAKQTISKGKISIQFVFLCLHVVYRQSYN